MVSAAQRDAINLVVYCELPQKQAASIMGVSLKALESLLVRAKRALVNNVGQLKGEFAELSPDMRVSQMNNTVSKPRLTNIN